MGDDSGRRVPVHTEIPQVGEEPVIAAEAFHPVLVAGMARIWGQSDDGDRR